MLDRLRIYDTADILVHYGVIDSISVMDKNMLAIDIHTAHVRFFRNLDQYYLLLPVEKKHEEKAYIRYPGVRRVLWSEFVKASEQEVLQTR
jgi:hypothetical protein